MTANAVLCVKRIISEFPDINEGVFCVGYNHYWTKIVEFCRIKWEKNIPQSLWLVNVGLHSGFKARRGRQARGYNGRLHRVEGA